MKQRRSRWALCMGTPVDCKRLIAAIAVLGAALFVVPQSLVAQDVIGSIQQVQGRGSPHPYPASAAAGGVVWTDTFQFNGASFVKLCFGNCQLGANDRVIVRDPQNLHRQTFTKANGITFWAVSVQGDTAIVELVSDGVSGGAGLDVIRVGLGSIFKGVPPPLPLLDPPCFACGPDVECSPATPSAFFPGLFVPPAVFPCRTPVCAIVYPFNAAGEMLQCTGWVIGSPNQVITNKHCEPAAADGGWPAAECWFNSEAVVCDGAAQKPISMYSVAAEVCASLPLDYSVLSVHPILPEVLFPAAAFGQLTVRTTPIVLDEVTHVFHHSDGCEKQYSGGTVTALVGPGCVANAGFPTPGADEFNSSALIMGGASGSPVMGDDCCVFGLLHCQDLPLGCNTNISVKMSSILADPAFAVCLPNVIIWTPPQVSWIHIPAANTMAANGNWTLEIRDTTPAMNLLGSATTVKVAGTTAGAVLDSINAALNVSFAALGSPCSATRTTIGGNESLHVQCDVSMKCLLSSTLPAPGVQPAIDLLVAPVVFNGLGWNKDSAVVIPAVSDLGLVALLLLTSVAGVIVIRRSRRGHVAA